MRRRHADMKLNSALEQIFWWKNLYAKFKNKILDELIFIEPNKHKTSDKATEIGK